MTIFTGQEREDLRIELAIAAMQALIPTFGEAVEPRREVIAHKSFRLAEAMLQAYDKRTWEFPK